MNLVSIFLAPVMIMLVVFSAPLFHAVIAPIQVIVKRSAESREPTMLERRLTQATRVRPQHAACRLAWAFLASDQAAKPAMRGTPAQ